jgi:hypothetical protein
MQGRQMVEHWFDHDKKRLCLCAQQAQVHFEQELKSFSVIEISQTVATQCSVL